MLPPGPAPNLASVLPVVLSGRWLSGNTIIRTLLQADHVLQSAVPPHVVSISISLLDRQVTDATIAAAARRWPSLVDISLMGCLHVSDETVASLAVLLPGLKRLDLGFCRGIGAAGVLALARGCPRLEALRMDSWCVPGWAALSPSMSEALTVLARSCPLKEVSFRYCTWAGSAVVDALAQHCPDLRTINLTCNEVSGGQPCERSLCALANGCRHLQCLDLCAVAEVTDRFLIVLAHCCRGLEELDLIYCPQVSDVGISALSEKCRSLRRFGAGNARVTDLSVFALASNCPKLLELEVGNCVNLQGLALRVLAESCPGLRVLSLGRCEVTDKAVDALARNCHRLVEVHLSERTRISAEGVLQLRAHRVDVQYSEPCAHTGTETSEGDEDGEEEEEEEDDDSSLDGFIVSEGQVSSDEAEASYVARSMAS